MTALPVTPYNTMVIGFGSILELGGRKVCLFEINNELIRTSQRVGHRRGHLSSTCCLFDASCVVFLTRGGPHITSFERLVEQVKSSCVMAGYPTLEEYDFRQDYMS